MREEYKDIIFSIKASMAIEGLEPSDYAIDLLERYIKGEITVEEYIDTIRNKHCLKKG